MFDKQIMSSFENPSTTIEISLDHGRSQGKHSLAAGSYRKPRETTGDHREATEDQRETTG